MNKLESIPVFQSLSEEGKALFKREMQLVRIDKPAQILHKDSQVSGAYIVIGGRLRVYSISPSGSEATLYCINPGETCVIALNCLFQNIAYPAWVETEPDTVVAVIPGAAYRSLFRTEPSIQDLTVQALSTSVFRLMEELEQLHFCKLEHRLASLILTRSASDGRLRMTHQEMAYNLGTAREVVSRIINLFTQNNYIETSRGSIIVTDPDAMMNMISENI
ncbi:MAG: Crp/Fnr family transcriptional regulator [Deferribacterales bacterium]